MNIEDAILLAATFHYGQTDKAGRPYILHLLRVMHKQAGDDAMMVAILHDLLEDTEITVEGLQSRGCPKHILDAVICLTRRYNECYQSYIKRVAECPLSLAVKLADLEDNMDERRLPGGATAAAKPLMYRYAKAYKFLLSQQ